MADEKKTLISKLAAVMAVVTHVEKDGKNSFQNYSYATEAAVMAAVRNELASRNIMMFTTWEKIELTPGAKQMLTEIKTEHLFVDGDSDEQFHIQGYGQGLDAGDKGVWKALTGAVKYALLKTFLIPAGDDPEKDSPSAEGIKPKVATTMPRFNAADYE